MRVLRTDCNYCLYSFQKFSFILSAYTIRRRVAPQNELDKPFRGVLLANQNIYIFGSVYVLRWISFLLSPSSNCELLLFFSLVRIGLPKAFVSLHGGYN